MKNNYSYNQANNGVLRYNKPLKMWLNVNSALESGLEDIDLVCPPKGTNFSNFQGFSKNTLLKILSTTP